MIFFTFIIYFSHLLYIFYIVIARSREIINQNLSCGIKQDILNICASLILTTVCLREQRKGQQCYDLLPLQ